METMSTLPESFKMLRTQLHIAELRETITVGACEG